MRITLRLTAVAVAATLLSALAGCAPAAAPRAPTSPPVAGHAIDLVPAIWRVRDARGEVAATWVSFDAGQAQVFRPKGTISLGWATQGDAMMAVLMGWSGSLGSKPTVPWLTDATRFGRVADGWVLLDRSGAVTARLVRDGLPPASKQWLVEVPRVTADTRKRLADAIPGAGVSAIAASALVGRWAVAGRRSLTPSVTFSADGQWHATTSCRTGTNPGEGGGGYRLLPSGMLLLPPFAVAGVGCGAPRTPLWSTSGVKAINGMASARSVRIHGTTATFYDRTGAEIGSLVRRAP